MLGGDNEVPDVIGRKLNHDGGVGRSDTAGYRL